MEVHSVAVEGSATVIDDWMFCEVPDMINVLVEDAGVCVCVCGYVHVHVHVHVYVYVYACWCIRLPACVYL